MNNFTLSRTIDEQGSIFAGIAAFGFAAIGFIAASYPSALLVMHGADEKMGFMIAVFLVLGCIFTYSVVHVTFCTFYNWLAASESKGALILGVPLGAIVGVGMGVMTIAVILFVVAVYLAVIAFCALLAGIVVMGFFSD